MPPPRCADVVLYVCCNCTPQATRLPRQWMQNDLHVQLREVPCSGKIDAQYLFHALEGGARALGVVACPHGECRLAQGNYRAEIRLKMVRRLLGEMGLEPERVALLHGAADETPEHLEKRMREAVERFAVLKGNCAIPLKP